MRTVAVVGSLTRDVVEGGPPRTGGAPFHAARALRLAGRPAVVVAGCADADAPELLPPLEALGVPVRVSRRRRTPAFSFAYDDDLREMRVDAVGEPWRPEDVAGLGDVAGVHAGAVLRGEFPADTLAELARGRLLSLDGQGLVRAARPGPLALEPDPDAPALLAHVGVLKLAAEEAHALVGEPDAQALERLGVPEVLVTHGSAGALVWSDGRLARVGPRPLVRGADPTGAGDAFAVLYLGARVDGKAPLDAAEQAAAGVARLLSISR